jgi:hypothetical protein
MVSGGKHIFELIDGVSFVIVGDALAKLKLYVVLACKVSFFLSK